MRKAGPEIAAAVDSMREDILEGETGLLFRPGEIVDLAAKIHTYFVSESFRGLATREQRSREYGPRRFSWTTNAACASGVRAPAVRL